VEHDIFRVLAIGSGEQLANAFPDSVGQRDERLTSTHPEVVVRDLSV
jgi:hypothetical protein